MRTRARNRSSSSVRVMSGSWLSSVLNATRNFLVGLPCASIERVHVEQAKVLRPVDDALGLVRAEGGGVVDQGAGDGGKGEAVDGGEVVGCQCAAMDTDRRRPMGGGECCDVELRW